MMNIGIVHQAIRPTRRRGRPCACPQDAHEGCPYESVLTTLQPRDRLRIRDRSGFELYKLFEPWQQMPVHRFGAIEQGMDIGQ